MAKSPRNIATSRRSSAMPEPDWAPPARSGPLAKRFGASILDDFVRGHSAADVFREIVQNEYDGGGSAIDIRFGETELRITGTGRPIPPQGWKRLSVVAGTGEVVGDANGDVVEPKSNGIGSKNFGIRSLFYFGDEVRIRSNGRYGLLDFKELGTDSAADPSSAGRVGVSIHVPFRPTETREVQAFDAAREAAAMDQISDVLLPTLVKLAGAGKRAGVKSFKAESVRTSRRIEWTQTAKPIACGLKGATAIRRSGRLRQWSTGVAEPVITRVEELEFARAVTIPLAYSGTDYPSYYKDNPTRLRVAVSLPLIRNRIDLGRTGRFFYPLQTPQSRTGCVVGVSAPFKLDTDRSSLLDTDWNAWLAREAAMLAQDLLQADWYARFGPDAFLALAPAGEASPSDFASAIRDHLAAATCWPTREVVKGRRTFTAATDIAIPDDPALDGFLGEDRYLDPVLSKAERARAMCFEAGAKSFTVGSLVRLRCTGPSVGLATPKTEGEADYHYTDYDTQLREIETQGRSAEALTTLARFLTVHNRADLRDTPSTLSAGGQLLAAHTLTRVEDANWDDCPIPLARRLDRRLNNARAVARHCTPFDLIRWVEDACARAEAGEIDEAERKAVYRWLLLPEVKLNPKLLARIRQSPVVRDRSGRWTRPKDLAVLPKRDAQDLGAVVPAPASDLAKSTKLLERLRIRRKVAAGDLLNLARAVQADPGLAPLLETALLRHATLLRSTDWTNLASIPCLMSRAGEVREPDELHQPTASNIEWLGDGTAIVAGSARDLYRRMGCRSEPDAGTLLGVLQARRESGAAPPRPEDFYPALVEAFRREKLSVKVYAQQPILFVGGQYRTPAETLLRSTSTKLFQVAATVFSGSDTLFRAYEALGAQTQVQPEHWIALYRWFEARAVQAGGVLAGSDRTVLKAAYRQSAHSSPVEMPTDLKFLSDDQGRLFSLTDLASRRLVENDYPALADALTAANAGVAFLDTSDETRSFAYRFSVQRLSEIGGNRTILVGAKIAGRPWLDQACRERMVLLHRQDFAVALAELAHAQRRLDPTFRPAVASRIASRLAEIARIDIVDKIRISHTLAGRTVHIAADAAIEGDRIALTAPRSLVDFDQMFSGVLAELLGATQIKDLRAMAPPIASLLRCRSIADVKSFLVRQGIALPPIFQTDANASDDLFSADERVEDAIRNIMGGLNTTPQPELAPTPPSTPAPSPPPAPTVSPPIKPPPPLPPLDNVTLTVRPIVADAPPAPTPSPGRGGGGGGWAPPTPEDTARDRLIGDRGEELVYRAELERVRAMGHAEPENVVIWTSRSQPGADHDIRSVDDNGGVLWIEVKATTGVDGRFEWSRNEFEKAMREGARYELVRVYEAGGASPTAVHFRNPAALQGGALRIELASLRAFVQPKS